MVSRFQGQAVIITGAASGLGATCAREFAAEGALLTLVDIDERELRITRDRFGLDPANAVLVAGSVAVEATAQESIQRAISAFGRVDVLVNNAAIDPIEAGSVGETSVDVWDRVMAVNLRGAYLFARAALPVMVAQGRGVLIHTASISALRPTPEEAAYSVSKAALLQLSRSIALDYGKFGIRSNCVCPGFLEAVMTDRAHDLTPEDLAARSQSAGALVPLGREGRYDEIAAAILYLASEASAYVSGSSLVVDGGMTLA